MTITDSAPQRWFEPTDDADAPPVAILNERSAARMFPNADPVGRRIRSRADAPWITIVGVVGDTRNNGFDRAPDAAVYLPVAQDGGNWNQLWLTVRVEREPAAVLASIRRVLRSIDPDQPIS